MAMTMDDRIAITDLINSHGHIIDRGDFDGLATLFTEDVVHAVAKGLGVMADGSTGSVTYHDTVERTSAGWRITHRIVRPRRTPLQD